MHRTEVGHAKATIRRLLHEICDLNRRQAQGAQLRPAQLVKLQRESALRVELAGLQSHRLPAHPVMGDWACPNPLCGATNWHSRQECHRCRIIRPAIRTVVVMRIWSRAIARRWRWAAHVIQRQWRRALRIARERIYARERNRAEIEGAARLIQIQWERRRAVVAQQPMHSSAWNVSMHERCGCMVLRWIEMQRPHRCTPGGVGLATRGRA